MSDNNNGGELGAFLAGFVIGGLVGAATALILAPQSGSETRNKIVTKSNDLVQSGEDQIHHAQESASNYAQHLQAEARSAGEQASEQTRIVLDSGKDQVSRLRRHTDDSITDLNNSVQGDAPAAE